MAKTLSKKAASPRTLKSAAKPKKEKRVKAAKPVTTVSAAPAVIPPAERPLNVEYLKPTANKKAQVAPKARKVTKAKKAASRVEKTPATPARRGRPPKVENLLKTAAKTLKQEAVKTAKASHSSKDFLNSYATAISYAIVVDALQAKNGKISATRIKAITNKYIAKMKSEMGVSSKSSVKKTKTPTSRNKKTSPARRGRPPKAVKVVAATTEVSMSGNKPAIDNAPSSPSPIQQVKSKKSPITTAVTTEPPKIDSVDSKIKPVISA